jgi:membrane protease YdiL (CAAX protease family)
MLGQDGRAAPAVRASVVQCRDVSNEPWPPGRVGAAPLGAPAPDEARQAASPVDRSAPAAPGAGDDAPVLQSATPARGQGGAGRAIVEILLCSGVPSQLVIGAVLTLAGWPPFSSSGTPRLGPLFFLSLADTVLLILLITALLWASGERVRPLLRGTRSFRGETILGLLLVPVLFIGVGVTVLFVRRLVPSLHNVPTNPFEEFLKTPTEAGLFAVVAIVAGGVREEVQRVFLLHRFEQHLGGAVVGLIVVSIAFGAGHAMQGWDASIATGMLGLTWGWIYLRRRSAVAPIVSHAGYNALQILQAFAVPALRA